jgi:hypothetical protein
MDHRSVSQMDAERWKGAAMTDIIDYRIMQKGAGWYWEVIRDANEVIAHGIAATHAQARAQAAEAAQSVQSTRIHF